jgi:hypothetical protein
MCDFNVCILARVCLEEELNGEASPDATFEGATSYEATALSGSSPLSRRRALEYTAADVKGVTVGIVVAEDKDNTVAAAVDVVVDHSFNTEEPAAVTAASSMADSAADVAIEALTHQEGIIEFSDGSVYVGQTRLSDLGVIQCHGLGIK